MKLLTTHRLPIAQRLPLFSILQKGRKHAITSLGNNSRYFSSLAEDLEHDAVHDDAKATEKDAALHLALSQLSNEFGRESTLSLQRFFGVRHVPVIPTGSLKLDIALGIGGLPKGRFVEIYGQEASGKSTLALHIIKEAQKLGGIVDRNIIPDITGVGQVRVFGVVDCPFPPTQRKTTLPTGTDVSLRCGEKRTTISDAVTDTNGFFEITFNTLETSLFHPNQCDRCWIAVRGTNAASCLVSPARRGDLFAPINCRDVVVERLHGDEQGHRDVLHYKAGPFYFDPSY